MLAILCLQQSTTRNSCGDQEAIYLSIYLTDCLLSEKSDNGRELLKMQETGEEAFVAGEKTNSESLFPPTRRHRWQLDDVS